MENSFSYINPVVETSEFAYREANLVQINTDGVGLAAKYVNQKKLLADSYTPRTWRTHHFISFLRSHTMKTTPQQSRSQWIFLISSLNFSRPDRYGVEWRASWNSMENKVWTGYWSLVAVLNRALDEEQSQETIPLLRERIAIMREVGDILCNSFGGSYEGLINEFQRRHGWNGTSLGLVKMVTESFPSFRDEVHFKGRKVYLWKRAQILVAETWAAFYPASPDTPHPIFPGPHGAAIHQLTMFADYRVPQILHHLRIISYPATLVKKLKSGSPLLSGSKEEVSLRAASIIAVERVREEIIRLMQLEGDEKGASGPGAVSSVLIDFYLWDLAKKIESGEEKVEGIETAVMVPIHRTRSIWY
ncbi:hypothetical protein BDQ17DRAFT_1343164 [Cyathus striatus]|nr:hypothetical protein BDQ17DRAFT_1343164 [Cyathus striatus]